MELFTSDEHYGHQRILDYCNRPFNSIEEMNQTLIDNNNKVVSPNDTVYHIGDFSFCNPDYILKQLKGKHILITGSHDHKQGTLWHKVFQYQTEIKIQDKIIFLSHYAHRRWPKSHYGAFHLYGHSHGNLGMYGYSFDVGVDAHDYKPWSFNEVCEVMNNKVVTEYKIFKGRYER